MSAMSDAIIVYAILRKFNTPVTETSAYKLGLVDETGKPTEKSKHIDTMQSRDAYTLLDRLVFKLKRLFKNMPLAAKLIGGYAAALAFLNESENSDEFAVFEHLDPNQADLWYSVFLGEKILGIDDYSVVRVAENPQLLSTLVESYINGDVDSVCEDVVAAAEAPPAGNTTAQVQGLSTEPVITPATQKKWTSKNKGRKIEELLS